MNRFVKTLILASTFAALPAVALVRLGGGAAAGFAFPMTQFDAEAKTAPAAAARVYFNFFHWLSLEAGADFHLKHGAEGENGQYQTKLWSYRAGLVYKVDMGVFKPYVGGGPVLFNERIRVGGSWEVVEKPGMYVGPGLEYYFDEAFLAFGALQYNRAFDDARQKGRDTQYIKLDFGLAYFVF
jgi:hypothetical protein